MHTQCTHNTQFLDVHACTTHVHVHVCIDLCVHIHACMYMYMFIPSRGISLLNHHLNLVIGLAVLSGNGLLPQSSWVHQVLRHKHCLQRAGE